MGIIPPTTSLTDTKTKTKRTPFSCETTVRSTLMFDGLLLLVAVVPSGCHVYTLWPHALSHRLLSRSHLVTPQSVLSQDRDLMWRIAVTVVAFFSASSFTVTDGGLIGGCAGTQYGCCPDGLTRAGGLGYYGCSQSNVTTSPACQAFLDSLEISCVTRTDCLDMECNGTLEGIPYTMELDVHKCRNPPSINFTLTVPSFQFRWSHELIGNTTMIIPNLQMPIPAFPGVMIRMLIDNSIYRKNRDIYMSTAFEPSIGFSAENGFALYRYVFVDDDQKLPINTSDCYGPAQCFINCSNCFSGDDGWACYTCPSSTCPSQTNHPVCGSDMKSYASECNMRAKACDMTKALRVLYPGRCVSEPHTQFRPLTVWPTSLTNVSFNTQMFIRGAVVFLIVSVNRDSTSTYTPASIADKLSLVLGYNVIVPAITKLVRTRRGVDDLIFLNVTMYAHYHSSKSSNEVFVPNTELVSVIHQNKAKIEMLVNVQIVSTSRSYTSQPSSHAYTSQPSTDTSHSYTSQPSISIRADSSDDSSTTIIVAVVVSLLVIVVLVVAVLAVCLYYQKRKRSGKVVGKEDVVYLPEQDQLEFEVKANDSLNLSTASQ